MDGVRPLLRMGVLGLTLLSGGCVSGFLPGTDTTDTSCMLLCALTRDLTGEPAPTPMPAPAVRAPARMIHKARPPAKRVVAKPVGPVHPLRRKRPTQVSVVPQTPTQPKRKAVTLAPPSPPPVAVLPPPPVTEPARSLSEAIPGSFGILAPNWRGQ